MILYTMMPQELIFPPQLSQAVPERRLVSYQGIPLLVEPTEDHAYQVVQVISTDPQHFLNANILPGTKISF